MSSITSQALFILTFGVGDLASTWYAIKRGAVEANPISRFFIKHTGFMGFTAVKAGYMGYVLLETPLNVLEVFILPACIILGSVVTVSNIYMAHQDKKTVSMWDKINYLCVIIASGLILSLMRDYGIF